MGVQDRVSSEDGLFAMITGVPKYFPFQDFQITQHPQVEPSIELSSPSISHDDP